MAEDIRKKITAYQLSLLYHTLGGKNPRKWHRNHFVVSPGHNDLEDLQILESLKLMKQVPAPSFCDNNTIVFIATKAGKNIARC